MTVNVGIYIWHKIVAVLKSIIGREIGRIYTYIYIYIYIYVYVEYRTYIYYVE